MEEPKLTDENWLEDAKYLGDKECKSCHGKIYRQYKRSQMGRSFLPITDKSHADLNLAEALVKDTVNNYLYSFVQKNGEWFQKEVIKNKENELIHELEFKVDYVVGSGDLNKSFITVQNGYALELPVTWYPQKKKWDLSPGYHQGNPRFFRSITKQCMNCHNSPSGYVEHSENKYTNIQHGISCESCHGPGEYHVGIQDGLYESSTTGVINPIKLSRERELDVCAQCHLQGEVHLKKKEFKPSQILADTEHIYFYTDHQSEQVNIAGHVARLSYSKCFKMSDLTCTSCHNPHLPLEEQQVKRVENCMSCHTKGFEKIKDHSPDSDCFSCHMPKNTASDIPHVNVTDHWIRVRNNTSSSKWGKQKDHSKEIIEYLTQSGTDAELGRAYVKKYMQDKTSGYHNPIHLERATQFLKGATSEEGIYAKGKIAFFKGNYSLAIDYLNRVQKTFQADPEFFFFLGKAFLGKNNISIGKSYLQQSLKVYPTYFPSLIQLSNLHLNENKVQSALTMLETVLNEQPFHKDALYQKAFAYHFYTQKPFEEKEMYYSELFKYYPFHHDGYLNYSALIEQSGNITLAIKTLEKIEKKYPKSVKVVGNICRLYFSVDRKKALVRLNQLKKQFPNDPRVNVLEQMSNEQ